MHVQSNCSENYENSMGVQWEVNSPDVQVKRVATDIVQITATDTITGEVP